MKVTITTVLTIIALCTGAAIYVEAGDRNVEKASRDYLDHRVDTIEQKIDNNYKRIDDRFDQLVKIIMDKHSKD